MGKGKNNSKKRPLLASPVANGQLVEAADDLRGVINELVRPAPKSKGVLELVYGIVRPAAEVDRVLRQGALSPLLVASGQSLLDPSLHASSPAEPILVELRATKPDPKKPKHSEARSGVDIRLWYSEGNYTARQNLSARILANSENSDIPLTLTSNVWVRDPEGLFGEGSINPDSQIELLPVTPEAAITFVRLTKILANSRSPIFG